MSSKATPIKRKHNLVIAVALLLLVAVSAGAAWSYWNSQLPDPAKADREGLMTWMVTRDLEDEPEDVRNVLIDRLEQELRTGIDLDQVDGEVDRQQSEKFWANVDVLLEQWFLREAEQYGELEAARRSDALNQTIDDVLDWQYVRDLRKDYQSGQREGGEFGLLQLCQQRTRAWIEKAQPQKAEVMNQFFAAVTQTLLVRQLTGSLPRPEES